MRALRHRGRWSAISSSGSSASPTTPSACWTTSTCSSLAREGHDDAAQLDRPQRGRRGRRSACGERRRTTFPSSRPARTRSSARPSSSSPRSIRWRRCADRRTGHADEVARLRRGRRGGRSSRRGTPSARRRALHRRTVRNPVNGERGPDLDRRLRADGVRDRRNHGGAGARRSRLRVRHALRPADSPGHRGNRPRRGPRRRRPAIRRATGR